MFQLGHMHELEEIRQLPPFLEQVAAQICCALCLLQPDGTVIYQGQPIDVECAPECVTGMRAHEIVAQWLNSPSLDRAQEIGCPCGKRLLILPLCWGDRIDGILTAHPFAKETQPFLESVAGMINSHLACARDAVREMERGALTRRGLQALYNIAERREENLEHFYRTVMEAVLHYIQAEVAMFVPRNADRTLWEPAHIFVRQGVDLSEHWKNTLASTVTTLYDISKLPNIMTPDLQVNHPELSQLRISRFISTSFSDPRDLLGILVFCSRDGEHSTLFEDLVSLESLKSLMTFGLYSLYTRREREELLTLRARHDLARRVIHDLKTPATTAQIFLKHLQEGLKYLPSLPPDLDDHATNLCSQIDRISAFAEAMQRLNRPLESRKQKADIHEIIQQAIRKNVTCKKCHISYDLCSEEPILIIDIDDIDEAIMHLITNALKAMQYRGALHVQTQIVTTEDAVEKYSQLVKKLDKCFLLIAVQDTGCGVDADVRDRIFHPGVSTTGSSGIGLYWVRMIAEEHGGAAWLEDTGPEGSI